MQNTKSDVAVDAQMWSYDDELISSQSSDWNIAITCKDGSNAERNYTAVYNVHRTVLESGPHPSEYFVQLFQREFSESKDCTIRCTFPPLLASRFPLFLDCLYSKNSQMFSEIDTNCNSANSAMALIHLADYFGVPTLLPLASRKLLDFVELFQLSDIDCTKVFDVPLLCLVANSTPPSAMSRLGRLILIICSKDRDTLQAAQFQELTNNLPLLRLSLEETLQLLQLEQQLLPSTPHKDGPADANWAEKELSDLQKRCVEAIALRWSILRPCDVQTILLKQLRPFVVSKIWQRCHERATEGMPHSIVVESAGSSCVNGAYVWDEASRMWIRDGIRNHRPCVFCIRFHHANYGRDEDVWWWSIISESYKIDDKDEDEEREGFYVIHTTTASSDYLQVPSDGWENDGCGDMVGEMPCPTLVFQDSNRTIMANEVENSARDPPTKRYT